MTQEVAPPRAASVKVTLILLISSVNSDILIPYSGLDLFIR